MSNSAFRNTCALIGFLWRESDLRRSPVAFFVVASSLTRTGMIWAINETAERGLGDPLMIAFLLAMVVAMLATTHWARMSGHALVQSLTLKMRRRLNRQLLDADVTFFQNRDQGSVSAASREYIHEVSATALRLMEMVQAVLLLIFCLIYMALQSFPSMLAAVVALIAGVAAFLITEIPARRAVTANNAANVSYFDKVNDLLRGYKELRLRRTRRDDLADRVDVVVEESRRRRMESERWFSYGQVGASGSLAFLLVAIVILLPLTTDAQPVEILQIVTLVLFSFTPIEATVSNLPGFVRATVSYQMILDVQADLQRKAEARSPEKYPDNRAGFRSIELRGVGVTLSRRARVEGSDARDTFTLGPIDLTLVPGQSVFITGGNGMGKSTLLQILTGLRYPDTGQILLDGVPVTRDHIADYRAAFSAVFSEFYLFRQLYGLTPSEREKLAGHIETLGLAQGVSITGDAFASLSLSTGQMRRLALAVALAEERPILVLDEFAADQDPARRRYFYDELVPRLARDGHTVIAVTHDEHCFDKCDRLIRMEAGKIVSDRVLAGEKAGV